MIVLGLSNDRKAVAIDEGPSRGAQRTSASLEPTQHILVDMESGPSAIPNEPPPSFSPYLAEFFTTGTGDVISHDPHLNTDGEALYRFLLSQSQVLPTLRISFTGVHHVTTERRVSYADEQGRHRHGTESYTETVTDFDFCIDVGPEHLLLARAGATVGEGYKPLHFSVADDEPVYRGKMVREYDTRTSSPDVAAAVRGRSRKATRHEIKRYKNWLKKKQQFGYPPWMRASEENQYADGIVLSIDNSSLRSSKTLREWADEYCVSPKYLKQFQYEKVLYGWNLAQLEKSLRSLINATYYEGQTTIEFTTRSSKIYIRSSNRVSRMLSNQWIKFLSIILLIFPFIWLFKRFHRKGGGTWEVCGGAYPLKQWVPLGEGETVSLNPLGSEEERLPPYPNSESSATPGTSSIANPFVSLTSGLSQTSAEPSARYIQTASGMRKLMGIREGEWLKNWEISIVRAVHASYQSTEPMRDPIMLSPPNRRLEVYNEATGLLVDV